MKISLEERINLLYHIYKKTQFTSDEKLKKKEFELQLTNQYLSKLKIDKIVLGKIVKRIKGGFLVEMEEYDGYLPFSEYSIFPFMLRDLNLLIGVTCELNIIRISIEPFVIIFSRKSLQKNPLEENQKREILIEKVAQFINKNTKSVKEPLDVVKGIFENANEEFYSKLYKDLNLGSTLNEFDKDLNQALDYNVNIQNGPFCHSCEQAPCLCSDPEKTSTEWL